MTIILAADVGGTKTILGLYTFENNKLLLQMQERYESSRFKSFSQVLQTFLSVAKLPIDIAVLACAGPIEKRKVKLTNLNWIINADDIERKFHIDRVELINDLQGIAYAVPEIPLQRLFSLNRNKPDTSGNKAILAPGTGLGMATLVHCRQEWHAVPSEGGHADFAPTDEIQTQLLAYLARKGQVDIESVLSGQGILNIYYFLKKNGTNETKPTAEDISIAAIERKDKLSVKTMKVFVSILERTAANLALQSIATGGVYFAGGIIPKIIPLLKNFNKQFCHKGKMQRLLRKIPVFVVTDENAAVRGAAVYATMII